MSVFDAYKVPKDSPFKISDYDEVALTTSNEEIKSKYDKVKQGFASGKTIDIEFRKEQLRNLYYSLHDNMEILADSLYKDFNRSPLETEMIEGEISLAAVQECIDNVDKWTKPEKRSTSLLFSMSSPQVIRSPLGVVLIITPWNYPIYLTYPAIASAIAAGNTVVFKPSEMLDNNTRAITKALQQSIDPSVLQVVNGGVPEATYLLDLKFDKIMVTGSTQLGRIVYKAAAKQLTPVLLELGGKSPVLIGKTANLKTAAKRILWGKLTNGGQTCVAPDYIIVEESVEKPFIEALKDAFIEFYPKLSSDSQFTHLVSDRMFNRFQGLAGKSKGKIEITGDNDEKRRFFYPRIMSEVSADDAVMQEELFGPILPILKPVKNLATDGVQFIVNNHDTPLALYIFSQDKTEIDYIINHTRSGGIVVNDTIMHVGCKDLPFGGIGESGTGHYHSFYGFEAFSHQRAIMKQPNFAEALMSSRYAPLTLKKIKLYQFMAYKSPGYSRTGPVRKSILKRLFGGKYVFVLFALITALLYLS